MVVQSTIKDEIEERHDENDTTFMKKIMRSKSIGHDGR